MGKKKRIRNTTDKFISSGASEGEGGGVILKKNPYYVPPTKAQQAAAKEALWNRASMSNDTREHYKARNQYTTYNTRMNKKAKSTDGSKVNFKEAQYEQDVNRINNRKKMFETGLYKALGASWKGNEWMKKATEKVWSENLYNTKATYTRKTLHDVGRTTGNTGGEGGQDITSNQYRGYGQWDEKSLNRLAHSMTGLAADIRRGEERDKEGEKRKGEAIARGGQGSRGSTIMTGGHQGILGKARTRRQTLMGREDRTSGKESRGHGSRRHKWKGGE
jgi:hypothetical protein